MADIVLPSVFQFSLLFYQELYIKFLVLHYLHGSTKESIRIKWYIANTVI